MSSRNWPIKKLEDCTDFLTGYPFKSALFSDNDWDIPLVKGADVQQGYIYWEKCKRWPSSDKEIKTINKYWLRKGDVILAMDRPWVPAGLKWGWIKNDSPKALLVQRVARLRGRNGLKTDFLRYLIASPQFTDYIKPIVTGVNVPHISGSQILGFTFRLPPLPVQRKIASILSAYDDLIENNLRRIKILEEMAQNLYREWFVKFRFPGYENTRFVDSPFGKIPVGWEICQLVDICHITMGQSPKSEYYNSEGLGLPFHQGVTDFGNRFPTERLFCTIDKRIANKGDILFSVRAPVGRINLSNTKIVIGRGLSAIRHKEDLQHFTYRLLKEKFQVEDTMGGGSIFNSVTKKDMDTMRLLIPNKALTNVFEHLVESMEIEINNLTYKNKNLRQTRDLLLPKLISGEVDVSELNIETLQETPS